MASSNHTSNVTPAAAQRRVGVHPVARCFDKLSMRNCTWDDLRAQQEGLILSVSKDEARAGISGGKL